MITTPQDNTVFADSEQRAIEKAKNIVTNYESEAKRLGQMVASEEYTITELHKRKVELEGQLAQLSADIAYKSAELASVNASVDHSVARMEEMNTRLDARELLVSKLESDSSERFAEIIAREEQLNKNESSSLDRAIAVTAREEAVTARENRIKELMAL